MSDVESRLAALEHRVRSLEDELELMRIMVKYGPAVDSGSADEAAGLWIEDGVYDTDGTNSTMNGQAAVHAMVLGEQHQSLLPNAAHMNGPGMVVKIDGDTALGFSYSKVCRRGDQGFWIWRIAANVWEFVRTDAGWKVERRTNRLMGSADYQDQLKRALS